METAAPATRAASEAKLPSLTPFKITGMQGLEPQLPDPESGVLPLHYIPTTSSKFKFSIGLLSSLFNDSGPQAASTGYRVRPASLSPLIQLKNHYL